jgi:hypothetical protein
VKFTYTKSAGNIALDDVTISHGKVDTVFVLKNAIVSALQYLADNLTENETYYYRVRAKRGDSYSAYSDPIKVTTLATGIKNNKNSAYKIGTFSDAVSVSNLQGNETICVYSVTGNLLQSIKVASNAVYIPLKNHGMYILQIHAKTGNEVYKVIR